MFVCKFLCFNACILIFIIVLCVWFCLLSRRQNGGGFAASCSSFTWAGSHRSSGASVTLTRWLLPLVLLLHRWRMVVLLRGRDRLQADSRGKSFTIETCAASSPPSYLSKNKVGSRTVSSSYLTNSLAGKKGSGRDFDRAVVVGGSTVHGNNCFCLLCVVFHQNYKQSKLLT